MLQHSRGPRAIVPATGEHAAATQVAERRARPRIAYDEVLYVFVIHVSEVHISLSLAVATVAQAQCSGRAPSPALPRPRRSRCAAQSIGAAAQRSGANRVRTQPLLCPSTFFVSGARGVKTNR
eukprot:6193455-Pleurochrysis_carterae.AAC.2